VSNKLVSFFLFGIKVLTLLLILLTPKKFWFKLLLIVGVLSFEFPFLSANGLLKILLVLPEGKLLLFENWGLLIVGLLKLLLFCGLKGLKDVDLFSKEFELLRLRTTAGFGLFWRNGLSEFVDKLFKLLLLLFLLI